MDEVDKKIAKQIADNLLRLRKERDMSEKDAAALLGVTLRTYRAWENAAVRMTANHLNTFSRAYNVPVATFFIKGAMR